MKSSEQKLKRIVDKGLLESVRCLPCLACASIDPAGALEAMSDNQIRSHPHHVKTKGSGGGDTADNVIALCFKHHIEIHRVGNKEMASRYCVVKNWLIECGHIEGE